MVVAILYYLVKGITQKEVAEPKIGHNWSKPESSRFIGGSFSCSISMTIIPFHIHLFMLPTIMMIKLTLFVHRKPSLTVEEFEQYWTHEHPKALQAFNDRLDRPIRRYIQCHRNLPQSEEGSTQMGGVFGRETELDKGYEAVVEVWFDSVEKMVETYSHPLYKEMVSTDEAKFGAGPMKWVVTEEVKQWDYTGGS